jgi:Zn-dependent M28 family amino/carboxypeptidase
MEKRLSDEGWQVEIQDTQWGGHRVQNVIAKRGTSSPWVVLGAHYDTRMWADQDPNITKRMDPVPGANDGASGVAILLELGRILPKDLHKTVWLVFFDAEDNGDIPGYNWILGSQAFVAGLSAKPDAAVVIDMVGDKNLNIFMERNSNPDLTKQIWSQAATLGYESFLIPQYKWSMEDDHTPFLQAGIPAVDIIDFDYTFWHTTMDTPDQVSAKSLQVVGETLRMWLIHS